MVGNRPLKGAPKLSKRVEELFYREIVRQCDHALFATAEVDQAIANPHLGAPSRLWFGLECLLIAGANISKLLFGVSQAHANARKSFRAKLGVTDDSPFFYERLKMRNVFEHFDEQLIDWCLQHNKGESIVDTSLGDPSRTFASDKTQPTAFLRIYDPATCILTYRGIACDMRALANAVGVLREVALSKVEGATHG